MTQLPDAPAPGADGQVDTLYLDPDEAIAQAGRAARVPLTVAVDGRQVCWYIADADIPGAPPSCARLPASGMQLALAASNRRWPQAVRFAAGMDDGAAREEFRTALTAILADAEQVRLAWAEEARQRMFAAFRRRAPGEALRVMGVASRRTTVMQYAMRDWVSGFARLGHETRFLIEADDLSDLNLGAMFEDMAAFRPHLMLTINHLNNAFLPPGMVNAVWWQDPMPALTEGRALAWRDNDLVYALTAGLGFAESLARCGLPPGRLGIQSFVVDEALFHAAGPERRERKLVFVGSNTRPVGPHQTALAMHFEERLAAGDRIRPHEVAVAADTVGVDRQIALAHVLNGAVRRHAVRLACRQRELPVEVWGRFWEDEPEVVPFFKGEVRHGPELAALYRSASHALSVHCQLINHGRLGELACCGCIPVVFDVRHLADPPLWEGRVRYFRDATGLAGALAAGGEPDPAPFRAHFAASAFAERIIREAGDRL